MHAVCSPFRSRRLALKKKKRKKKRAGESSEREEEEEGVKKKSGKRKCAVTSPAPPPPASDFRVSPPSALSTAALCLLVFVALCFDEPVAVFVRVVAGSFHFLPLSFSVESHVIECGGCDWFAGVVVVDGCVCRSPGPCVWGLTAMDTTLNSFKTPLARYVSLSPRVFFFYGLICEDPSSPQMSVIPLYLFFLVSPPFWELIA